MDLSDVTTTQANVTLSALKFWYGSAERKKEQIRAKQNDVEEGRTQMTPSLAADIEFINTMLPHRMAAAEEMIRMIETRAGT
jgi:uncharacterized protein (DUF305 family)